MAVLDEYGEVDYDFEIDRIVSRIREVKASKILIQLPDGLKRYALYIQREIESRVDHDLEITFSGSSAWGACLLDDVEAEAEGYDLLIHIGHVEYSYYRPRYRTLFIPAYYLREVSVEALDEAVKLLRSRGADNIAVYSTIQHAKQIKKVALYLSKFFNIVNSTQIGEDPAKVSLVGCDYMKPYSIRDKVDAYVFVSGGVFHPLGLGLTVPFKPVIKIDPYENRSQDLTGFIEKKIRARLYKILEAREARRWALIDGVKGQNRVWFRNYLKKLIRSKGGSYVEYVSHIIDRNLILNIDSSEIDAFVILACPRIPTDDLEDYHKPVLTPAEARMALTGMHNKYSFPW